MCMGDAPEPPYDGSQPTNEPGAPTPPEVVAKLSAAFGADKVGELGYEIAAARCCSEQEKTAARQRGSSLLYGELLPDGVSKALQPRWLGDALASQSFVLELGMGSGKVALQIFLQQPRVRNMLGVELVESRFAIAEAALLRLATAMPQSFTVCMHTLGKLICLEELDISQKDQGGCGRKIEFQCADFFSLGLDLCERSDAIIFAVNVPCKAFPELCRCLSRVKEGCRLFTYHSLDSIWWLEEPCPFHQCEANVSDSDTFSTSWSPQGYRFYVYVCDRSRPSQIPSAPRNETYSQWQAIWDEASSSHYYHNQESEISQWEVPSEAGGWQAAWSEEHAAHFYWHSPTGHAQLEAPKCLADLGWGA